MSESVPGPPSAGPPPGWYPDPHGSPGYRWWNGVAWTDDRSTGATAGAEEGNLPPVGDLLSETFRILGQRVGHLFTLAILLLLLPAVLSWAATYAAFDGVVFEDGAWTGSSPGWIALAVLSTVVFAVAYAAFSAALVRHALAALAGSPEPWSSSAAGGLRRTPRVIGAGLAVWGATLVAVALLVALAALVGPFGVILVLVAIPVGLVFVWTRATLVLVAAAGGPRRTSSIAASWRLTKGRFWAVLARLLLLALLWVALQTGSSIVTGPVAGMASAAPEDAIVIDEETGELERLDLDGLIPDNLGVIGFTTVAATLILAASRAVTVIGRTSLYRSAGGAIDESLTASAN